PVRTGAAEQEVLARAAGDAVRAVAAGDGVAAGASVGVGTSDNDVVTRAAVDRLVGTGRGVRRSVDAVVARTAEQGVVAQPVGRHDRVVADAGVDRRRDPEGAAERDLVV